MEENIISLRIQVAELEERIRSMVVAKDLQAREYERRLAELNHAHEQQVERNAFFLPRELWEQYRSEQETWRREIDRWRWLTIGIAAAAGGIAAQLPRLLGS